MQKEEASLSSRGRWKRMTEPILYEVLEATGYLTDGEPAHGVYLSAEAGGQPRFRDFCPDALWRSESALTVYFKYEREDASEEQIAAWQREIWNHGFAPLLWVISPESIAVYNGFSRPREAGNAAAHLLDSFGRIEKELDRLDALAGRLAMETGEFWRQARAVHRRTCVDRQLLSDLGALEGDLLLANLDRPGAQGLIGRSIFTQYLIDRGIVTRRFLESHYGHGTLSGILRDRQATKRLFEWLRDTFNGDMFPAEGSSLPGTRHLRRVADFLDIDEPVETLEVEGSSPTQGLDVGGEDLPMTITDNDDSPQVTLTATPAQIGENGGTTTITATLDHPSSEFTSVTVSVTPSANASTADFNVSGNMVLEIQAGDTSSTGDTVTVTALDNEVDDPGPKNLSVTATVRNDVGFVAPDPLNLPIIDDEAESNNILLEVTPAQVLEGTSATVVTVTASLDGAARAEAVPVEVSVAGGTATAVTDFAAVSDFTIAIPANATSQTAEFTLSPVDDDIDEPDETVLLTGTTTVSGLADGTVSVTITDDDATPQATLVLTPAAISENSGSSTVTATLDRPSTEMTTITVTAAPVSPAVAADFTLSGTTLTIAAGAMSSTETVTIAANDNETYTGNKRVTISGTAENSQGIEQPTAQALTIEEDDTASTEVTFTVSPEEIQEDDSPQQVTVTAMLDGAARPMDTAAALTVHGVTAVAGTDFTAVGPFTLTIPAGATTGTAGFTLTPIDDSTDEPDRTVRVNLPASLPSLTVAPAAGWLEVTIEDDDPTPEAVLVLTPDSIREDGGSTTVTATLDRPSAEATTIEVTATPVSPADADDFTQSGTTLTIAAGATSSTGTVTVTARDNTIDHEDREVTVSGVAINALAIVQAPEQTLSITDDEDTSAVVTLTVVSSPDPVAEGESATVTVTATLDKAAREADAVIDVVVSGGTLGQSGRAREGADFSAVTDFAVTIPAGATTGTASFPLITLDDEVKETDETVLVTGTVNSTQTQGPALQVEPAGGVAVTISDDDPEPVVTLVLTPASISENGGSSTVTAELDRPYTGIVTVELTTTPGAATVADDFILSSSSLTIAAEDVRSSGTAVTIAGVNNILAESSKTVTVAGVANVTDVVQPTAQVLTITDDDTPSTGITLTVSPDRVAEDATTESVTVTAALNGAARSSDTPVIVSVTGGTASAGPDFATVADFTITIADGAVSGTHTFTLEPADDETDAPDRTILVRGQTSVAGLTVEPAGGLVVTIVDDDPAPVVTLALAPMEISEDGGTSTVTATLDRPSSAVISVDVQAAPVTPAVAGDFRLSSNKVLRFAAGQTASTGTVTVAAVDNDIAADDRQVEVSGTARTDDFRLGVDQPAALRLTIEDDEQPSTEVTLTVSPDSISEGATGTARRVTVTAELNGAARETVTAVAMTVTAGTATQGTDFAAVSDFTVTIPIGQKSGSATFTLAPLEDVIDEPDETVRLTGSLSGSALTLVQPQGGLTVTIEDNEPEPKVTLVLTPDSIREDGGSTEVTATLDSPSTAETTVTVMVEPVAPAVVGDFQLNGTTLTIPPGETESTGTVTIKAVDNTVEAPNKRVTVSATTQNAFGVGDPPDRTLTITDNEFPSRTVTLSVSPSEIQEGVSQTVTVTAELDGAGRTGETQIAITVGTGTAAATDFSPVTGFTLTIPAEQKNGSETFTLSSIDDDVDEPDETVVVRGRTSGLTVAPSGGVTVTIENDDPDPRVTLVLTPASISENGGSSTVTAELDHPSSVQTTVTVSAAAQTPAVAGDFRLRGTRLTIPAGQTVSTGTVTLSGVNNELTAPSKRVEVSGAAENAQGIVQPTAQTLTITDDDQPSTMVTLTVSPDRVSENGGAKRLTVTGALDGAPESADTVVTLRVNAGAAEAVEAVLTIPTGRRSATAVLILTPVDNAIDDDADATVTVNATSSSSLTLSPRSLDVTVTDDDERGVRVSVAALTVREGPDGASYTVVLGSQPTSTVTVTPSVPSQPPGTNLSVSPQSLDFTASNWNEPQTVTVTAAEDDVVEEDAVVELTHMVSGGDYGVNDVAAAAVTVTVLGYEESDGTVELKVPATGDPVVSVPEGTSMPELAGIEVTLPSGTDTVMIRMADDNHVALRDPPQGFRAGDLVVDIEPDPPLSAGQTAQVCLPASSGSQRVHRYDEDATPPEWVELEVPAGGSPQGLACGVTDHFTLFALGSAPGEMAVNSWLSRFGRTVAEQVVDMVTERLQSPREAGTLATLAGHGFGHPVVPPVLDGLPSGTGAARDGDREGWSRSLTGRELLIGTSFTMTGGETAAGSVAVWGRVAHTRFDGRDGAASVDGEVTTMALGMDRASGPWTWGVSLARSEGRGTHGLDDSSNRLRTSLTGLYPFVGYKAGDRLSLWGVAGYGEGDLELTLEGGEPQTTGLKLAMAATGARGELASGGDGFLLSLETDGLFVRTSSGDTADLAASEADASRLRLGLDASWALATESGGRLRPAFEVGLRHDGGDAETGMGVDIGGGIEWVDPALGLAVDLHAHGLLAHEAGGFAERGVSGSVLWDRDRSSERGLEATLSQSLGASGRAGDLLERRTMAGLGQADDGGSTGRLDAKLGYGLAVFGNRFTGTPWIGIGLSGSARDYTLGWRFRPSGGTSLDLGLEASRRETANDNGPEHGIGLRLTARW